MKGMVAAGHPLTAEAGARVLREGGNAVDAAIAAMLTSWVAEPLLTGPGAGGYMMVAGAGEGCRGAIADPAASRTLPTAWQPSPPSLATFTSSRPSLPGQAQASIQRSATRRRA